MLSLSSLLSSRLQDVVRQMPKSAHYRSMLSKQWTDCTYLDVGPTQLKLTDDDRRHFNQTAMEHAREVTGCDSTGCVRQNPVSNSIAF